MPRNRPGTPITVNEEMFEEYNKLLDEYIHLRKTLTWIYDRAGQEMWRTRRRPDTAGHVCDYRNALQAIKSKAKQAVTSTQKRVRE